MRHFDYLCIWNKTYYIMAKYQMNFEGIPCRIVGEARFSSSSSLNGKAYKDMSEKEKEVFRRLFLDAGASAAVVDDAGKYEYNYRIRV